MGESADEHASDGFWPRLRRRKVVQWGLGYVAAAWGLLQGLEFAVATFEWPTVVTRVAAVVAAMGVPVAVTVAWFHGDRGEQRVKRAELVVLAVVLLTGGLLIRQVANPPASRDTKSAASGRSHPTAAHRNRVAVLPFENFGGDPSNAAFVGGVHDTLITQIAKIPGLSVISRSSVMQFAGKHPTIRDVAAALGVGAVLEGSVQRDHDRLRVQAQLIDAATDAHLWAETYDRTADDLFAVQSEIALAIAEQLRIRLTDVDSRRLSANLTANPRAYEHYVLGRNHGSRKDWPEAIRELTTAVTIDPGFAAAHAQLSMARTWHAFDDPARRKDDLPLAKASVDRALEIDPTLPEAHLALALYLYRGEPDIERAASEFERAVSGLPNDAVAHEYFGYLRRWQKRWEEAAALFGRAAELDPRGFAVKALIMTLVTLGRRVDAARAITAAQAAQPDNVELALFPGDLAANFACDLHTMEEVLGEVARRFPNDPTLLVYEWYFGLQTGDSPRALKAVEGLGMLPGTPDEDLQFERGLAYLAVGRRAEAERVLRASLRDYLRRAGNWPPGENRAADLARVAQHYAVLGNRVAAVEYVNRALADLPPSGEGSSREDTLYVVAGTLAHAGRSSAAIETVRELLAVPSLLKPSGLWCDPFLAPLRADSTYRAMMAGYGVDVSIDPSRRETWPAPTAPAATVSR